MRVFEHKIPFARDSPPARQSYRSPTVNFGSGSQCSTHCLKAHGFPWNSGLTGIEQQLAKLTDPVLEERVEFSSCQKPRETGCLSVRAEWRAANDALRSLRFSPGQVYCE